MNSYYLFISSIDIVQTRGDVIKMNTLLLFVTVLFGGWFIIDTLYYLFPTKFEKKGLKIYYGLVLVYKKPYTVKPSHIIRIGSYLTIPLFAIALFLFYTSMLTGILIRIGVLSSGAPPQLLIPGINITGLSLLYFVLAIVVAAVVHELSHAYTARAHGINVKSLGFAIIFFVPIAFTEIDEEALKNANTKAKITMLSAGPASNFVIAFLAIIILSMIVNPWGLVIVGIVDGSLAEKYGLEKGMSIIEINGTKATLDALHRYLSVNRDIILVLKVLDPNGEIKEIHIYKPANTTKLGVYLQPMPSESLIKVIGVFPSLFILGFTQWLYIVNFSLALINAAPLFISDGGRILYELLKRKEIAHAINMLSLIILVLALSPI